MKPDRTGNDLCIKKTSKITNKRKKGSWGAFLREPGAQRQVSAKTLWFLSRAGDAAGSRAHIDVGESALQSKEEKAKII